MVFDPVNPLTRQIHQILTPLIGSLMAESSIRIQAKKVGATPDTITVNHLPFISAEIEKALKIFVGSDKAKEVALSIAALH